MQTARERAARAALAQLQRNPGLEAVTACSVAALELALENADRLRRIEEWQRNVDRAAGRLMR